jgi:hypothetical protein
MPARVQQSDILQMESQIWWHGCECLEATKGVGRRKPTLEADVCRSEPGTQGFEGYCRKKAIKPSERRELAKYAIREHGLSERQACKIMNLSRSVFRYEVRKRDEQELTQELLAVAGRKPRWGLWQDGGLPEKQGLWLESQEDLPGVL